MKKEDVKYYNDPDDFSIRQATYPCSTQFMEYEPLLHRYNLTIEGLQHYGLEVERRYTGNVTELIRLVSKKVYDYIHYKVGNLQYQLMMYRIATAPKTIYPDQYFMRKQFEQILIDQARFIIDNGDSARYSNYKVDSEVPATPVRPEDYVRDFSDISPEVIRSLEALRLTQWFNASGIVKPSLDRY